jgi:hypothetical protein
MKFPTYKYKIINHVKKITNDENTIALFNTLSDSLEYKDIIHIKNILQIFQQKIHLLKQRILTN